MNYYDTYCKVIIKSYKTRYFLHSKSMLASLSTMTLAISFSKLSWMPQKLYRDKVVEEFFNHELYFFFKRHSNFGKKVKRMEIIQSLVVRNAITNQICIKTPDNWGRYFWITLKKWTFSTKKVSQFIILVFCDDFLKTKILGIPYIRL